MINDHIWERFNSQERMMIRDALKTISSYGILKLQVQAEFEQLTNGPADENPEDLLKRIVAFRAETHGVMLIHNYGETLLKEQEDEEE